MRTSEQGGVVDRDPGKESRPLVIGNRRGGAVVIVLIILAIGGAFALGWWLHKPSDIGGPPPDQPEMAPNHSSAVTPALPTDAAKAFLMVKQGRLGELDQVGL